MPSSLHIFSPFPTPSFSPVSPLSSPDLSGLSALCQGKEHTFIEHLWYAKQWLVLSLLSSHPPVSTDLWSLLSSTFLFSAREGNGHLLSAYCVLGNFLTLPFSLNSPCSFISDFFLLLHPPFLRKENKQLWSTYCMPGNQHPTSSPLACFSLPLSFCQFLLPCVLWAFFGEGNKQ